MSAIPALLYKVKDQDQTIGYVCGCSHSTEDPLDVLSACKKIRKKFEKSSYLLPELNPYDSEIAGELAILAKRAVQEEVKRFVPFNMEEGKTVIDSYLSEMRNFVKDKNCYFYRD